VLKEQIAAWLLDAAFPLILAFSLGEKVFCGRRGTRKRLSPIPPQVFLPSGERVSHSMNRSAGLRSGALVSGRRIEPGRRPALQWRGSWPVSRSKRNKGLPVTPRRWWVGKKPALTPALTQKREKWLPRLGKLATSDSSRFRGSMRGFVRGNFSPRERPGGGGTAHDGSRDYPGLVSPFEKLK
jgi:hypothetical protein